MDKNTVLRTAVLILALVNQWLSNHNLSPLPTTEDDLNTLILTGAALWTWYKDNPVSKEGKRANQKLKKYKAEKKYAKATGGTLSVIKDKPLGADIDIKEGNR